MLVATTTKPQNLKKFQKSTEKSIKNSSKIGWKSFKNPSKIDQKSTPDAPGCPKMRRRRSGRRSGRSGNALGTAPGRSGASSDRPKSIKFPPKNVMKTASKKYAILFEFWSLGPPKIHSKLIHFWYFSKNVDFTKIVVFLKENCYFWPSDPPKMH